MAKSDEQNRAVSSNRASYVRFHQPIQFLGAIDGVHNDTSKLRGAEIGYDLIGVRITFGKRTIVVGWPNVQFLEEA